jgi:hypothetical protein
MTLAMAFASLSAGMTTEIVLMVSSSPMRLIGSSRHRTVDSGHFLKPRSGFLHCVKQPLNDGIGVNALCLSVEVG